jgi:hypothetical protein
MSIQNDVDSLLRNRELLMPDLSVQNDAETWDLVKYKISAQKIATVYSFMKNKYEPNYTLRDMERITGIWCDGIAIALKALEAHGYITISRSSRPHIYTVIK